MSRQVRKNTNHINTNTSPARGLGILSSPQARKRTREGRGDFLINVLKNEQNKTAQIKVRVMFLKQKGGGSICFWPIPPWDNITWNRHDELPHMRWEHEIITKHLYRTDVRLTKQKKIGDEKNPSPLLCFIVVRKSLQRHTHSSPLLISNKTPSAN